MNYLTMVLKNIQKQERKRQQAAINNTPFPEYATLLTGASFCKIKQSIRLMDCFMELALTSRVLIACRLSPLQKAEVLELLKQYQSRKIVLAIGDGINDIEMLSRASIAVAVHGNSSCETAEGANNALRQADFALGQFKHLMPLLLVHGRENYRRNALTIFFMMYKALLIVLPMYFFAMQN